MIRIKNSLSQIIPLETGDTIQLEQIVTKTTEFKRLIFCISLTNPLAAL